MDALLIKQTFTTTGTVDEYRRISKNVNFDIVYFTVTLATLHFDGHLNDNVIALSYQKNNFAFIRHLSESM